MIKIFVENWEKNKHRLEEKYSKEHPSSYEGILKDVLELVNSRDYEYKMDTSKVHRIDDGDYQGTLLFLIPQDTYQPSTYFYVKVGYGSCSGCDTFEACRDDYDSYETRDTPTQRQTEGYMTMALHMVQGLKQL